MRKRFSGRPHHLNIPSPEQLHRQITEELEAHAEAVRAIQEGLPLPASATASVRAELAADRAIAWEVYKRDLYRCVRCGADGTGERNDLTVDHIIPVSAGGTNALHNLQTLCRSCNSKKGANP